jgi:hypothetical protein
MNFLFFFWEYVGWHYGRALAELIGLWRGFVWFFYHFFSMPLLVRTLFAPFHRLEIHERHIGLEERMSNIVANLLMRVFGFVMRTFMLAIGGAVVVATICIGVVVYLAWLLAPLTLLAAVIGGVYLIVLG